MERLAPAEIAGGAVGLIVGLARRLPHQEHRIRDVSDRRARRQLRGDRSVLDRRDLRRVSRRAHRRRRFVSVPRAPRRRAAASPARAPQDRGYVGDRRRPDRRDRRERIPRRRAGRAALRRARTADDRRFGRSAQANARAARFRRVDRLQEIAAVEISERDFDDMAPGNVDAGLVRLAQEMRRQNWSRTTTISIASRTSKASAY